MTSPEGEDTAKQLIWHLATTTRPWVRTGSDELREWVSYDILVDLLPSDKDGPLVRFASLSNERDAKWLLDLLNEHGGSPPNLNALEEK